MKLTTKYERTRFSETAIRKALAKFDELFRTPQNLCVHYVLLIVTLDNEEWSFDNEDDFFTAYPSGGFTHFKRGIHEENDDEILGTAEAEVELVYKNGTSWVSVKTKQHDLGTGQRASIQAVFQVLGEHEEDCRLPSETSSLNSEPVIFIGHGRSKAWRDLKDHLTDKHGYRVEAYEAGARAGHTVRDILQSMLERSSFALLVLTKEDETAQGNMRARQNVIHETGLFQGKLGFSRAIVLLENGTEDFSNISGVEQLRFNKIQETFGDVLATLKREFR
ncbi:MAG: nucleotide-binding protein [Bryobacterales bacterium]|nr:nucleotide-binding protein [Bryobacterales bacterium]MDE0296604.1 nucleotide-binding protein [Bryobacterales bacterium]